MEVGGAQRVVCREGILPPTGREMFGFILPENGVLWCVRSFVSYCGQGSSILWTPALRPLCRSSASTGRGGELVGVCGVCASCVGWRKA